MTSRIEPDFTDREKMVIDRAVIKTEERLNPKYHRVARSLFIMVIIGITGGGFGWGIISKQTKDIKTQSDQIQKSRYDVALDNCLGSNERNKQTLFRLSGFVKPESKQFKSTKVLIDALVPFHKDCETYARSKSSIK